MPTLSESPIERDRRLLREGRLGLLLDFNGESVDIVALPIRNRNLWVCSGCQTQFVPGRNEKYYCNKGNHRKKDSCGASLLCERAYFVSFKFGLIKPSLVVTASKWDTMGLKERQRVYEDFFLQFQQVLPGIARVITGESAASIYEG